MSASPRRNRRLGDRPVAAYSIAAGALLVAAAGSFGALSAAGVPLTGAIGAQKPAVHVQPALDLADSPAEKVALSTLTTIPEGWVAAAATTRPAPLPYPFSCNPDGGAPALSIGKHYESGGTGIDVVIAAYTAGLGAQAATALTNSVADCASGHATITATTGAGVQAWQVTGDRNNPTILFRRGDVLVFVSSPQQPIAVGSASAVDAALTPALAPVCAVEDADASAASRNRWSLTGYKPYTTTKTVTVKAAALPKLPKGATYPTTTIPAAPVTVPVVNPAPAPDYPVWPVMPALVATPAAPKAPTASPATTLDIQVLTADTTGPGCGWAFTGMKTPRFDTKTAKKSNDALIATATKQLNDGGKKWQKDVLAYWKGQADFLAKLPAYQQYAQQVSQVNTAWAEISNQWANYHRDHDAWQQRQDAYTTLQQQKTSAQADYEQALNLCMAGTPNTPTPTPTPSPTGTPTPGPTSTPAPTTPPASSGSNPVKKTLAECVSTVEKPAVLSEPYPSVGPEPQQPADPRPLDQRK